MSTVTMKFNIVENDGEATSATVFIGDEQLVATAGHKAFKEILQALVDGADENRIRSLFDMGKELDK